MAQNEAVSDHVSHASLVISMYYNMAFELVKSAIALGLDTVSLHGGDDLLTRQLVFYRESGGHQLKSSPSSCKP